MSSTASPSLSSQQESLSGKHVRLFAIGNSFSGNALEFLPRIVAATKNTFEFGHICIGGCPLIVHWNNAEAYEKGNRDPQPSAWAELTAKPWDFVTLQQFSMHSFKIETYRPYAGKLHEYIRKRVPQAEILIHQTWAYREDDPLFSEPSFRQPDMYRELCKAYQTIARELGARIIPSGDAFENARRDPQWKGVFPDPKFDYANPQYPMLPDQTHSLHTGYNWGKNDKGEWVLWMDGHHAGTAGKYLAGAVWYEFLFQQSVIGNSFVPDGMLSSDVQILQRIAHQTVAGNR